MFQLYVIKPLVLIFLLAIWIPAFAGGTSEEVNLTSLVDEGNDKYTLKYKSFESGKNYTIYLSYNRWEYLRLFKASYLTKDKYDASITLLKKQLSLKKHVRFGWFGGGPCLVDKENNIYRSDALDIIYEDYPNEEPKVVYSYCEYR